MAEKHTPILSSMCDPHFRELVWENGQILIRGLSSNIAKNNYLSQSSKMDHHTRPEHGVADSTMFDDHTKIDHHDRHHKNKLTSLQSGYRELLFSELYDKQTVNNLENFNESNVPQLEEEKEIIPQQIMNNDSQVPTCSPCLGAARDDDDDELQGKPRSAPILPEYVPDEQSEVDTRLPSFRVHHGPSSEPNTAMKGKHVEQIVPSSSSECSRGGSNSPIYTLKRRYHEDTDLSENNGIEETHETTKAAPSKGSKRKRKPEVHSLSEKKRRDKINQKMRALQELIPNCNKVDKASMLDEAIEYLKTLQLQVQMMSVGRTSGVYMPQMMLPASSIQHINARNFGGYSDPLSNIGMQMGLGCNPIAPFPSISASLMPARINQARVNNMFGLPGHMLLMSMFPSPSQPFVSLPASFPPQLVRTPVDVSQVATFTRTTSKDSNLPRTL